MPNVSALLGIDPFSSIVRRVLMVRGVHAIKPSCIHDLEHSRGFMLIDLLRILEKIYRALKLSNFSFMCYESTFNSVIYISTGR